MALNLGDASTFPYFLTVKDAAAIVRMSPEWLRTKIRNEQGPPVNKLGNRFRIRRDDFLKWAAKQNKG